MVSVKEVQEVLRKLKTNSEKLKYLKELLKEVKDKELRQNIKELIEDINELDAVAQIETRGRVDWSLPDEEETVEERRLERQVAFIPLPEEEKKEEMKIDYGLQSNVEMYQGRRVEESGIKYEGNNRRIDVDERNSFIDRDDNFIERRASEQFTGKGLREPGDETIMERYRDSSQGSRGYASLSEEIHEKERKKIRH